MAKKKPRIKIEDLAMDAVRSITEDDMKRVTGGVLLSGMNPQPSPTPIWDPGQTVADLKNLSTRTIKMTPL